MKFDNFYYIVNSGKYPNGEIVIKNDVWNYFANVAYSIFNILNRRVNKFIPAILEISRYYGETVDLVTMTKNNEEINYVLGVTTGSAQVTLFLNAILYGVGAKNNYIDLDRAVTLIYMTIYHELIHCDQNTLGINEEESLDKTYIIEEEAEYRSYKAALENQYIDELRIAIPGFTKFDMSTVNPDRVNAIVSAYDKTENYYSDYRFKQSKDAYDYLFDDILPDEINNHRNVAIIIEDNESEESWRFDIKANNVYIYDSLNFLAYVLRKTLYKGWNTRLGFTSQYTICKGKHLIDSSVIMATNSYILPESEVFVFLICDIEDYCPICQVYDEEFPVL